MPRCNSVAAVLVLCFATPVVAQSPAGIAPKSDSAQPMVPMTRAQPRTELSAPVTPDTTAIAPVHALAPTREAAAVALRLRTESAAPLPLPAPGKNSENTALMIVGGAALIVGAVIGGDAGSIIMIGGAGIGLYGLWQYLR